MAEQSFEEKTEKPTPQKREEVRKKGEVAKSRELPSVAVLLSGLITLSIFGSFMITRVREMTEKIFMKIPAHDLDAVGLIDLGRELIILFLVTMTPLLSVIFLTAVLSNVMQVGLMASIEQIKPKISKVNPLKGLQRLFSAQSLMELVKALMKLAIVGGCGDPGLSCGDRKGAQSGRYGDRFDNDIYFRYDVQDHSEMHSGHAGAGRR